jgi:capsular exopolysaccharide synthesis family protein
MSRIFDALIKAEEKAKPADRTVKFSTLSLFQNQKRPIKIDFDLDPFMEEQYQKLRRRLSANAKQQTVKVVMVAATTHGEGATTTSAILAATLARSGHSKILLIDANLRTPALDGVFNEDTQHTEGLSDVVAADVPVESAIYQTNFPNLFLLPVGKNHSSPSYLFDGDPITKLLNDLRDRFDFVIIDGAPLNGYSESFFLASKVDGVILVVEAERTKKQVVKKIKKELEWGPVNLLGVVVNKKKNYIPPALERFI